MKRLPALLLFLLAFTSALTQTPPGITKGQADRLYQPIDKPNVVSTSSRQAKVWQNGQVVWDSTAEAFYIGDGVTAGGVLSATGLTDEAALAQGYITPRHRRVGMKLAAAVKGATSSFAFPVDWDGNSVSEGDGSADVTKRPPAVFKDLLAAYTGISAASWTVNSRAVGGSTTATVICKIADNADASPGYPRRPTAYASFNSPVATVLITLRNDATMALPIAKWPGYLRICLQKLRRRGTDAFLVIDPPKINQSTGAILDTDANYGIYRKAALQVAAEEGASVVDVWKYWVDLARGGFDLRTLIGDGVHPNDRGNRLLTELTFQAFRMPAQPVAAVWDRGTDTTDGFDAVSVYNDYNGATLTNISDYGTLIGPTSRQIQNGESPARVFRVASGNSLYFRPIGPTRAVIVTGLTVGDATGKPVVTTLGGAPLTAIGELPNWTGPYVREYSIRYESSSGPVINTGQPIRIQASGGPIYVLGVTYVTDYWQESHSRWAAAVEAGTWSDSTGLYYSQTTQTRKSSSVGDTLTITWYGSSITFKARVNSAAGKFTIAHDGGGAATFDLYSASDQNLQMQLLGNSLGVGWHTTVITVATKNASASDNVVDVGGFVTTASIHPPSYVDVYLLAGEAYTLLDFWSRAEVLEVLSGSPTRQTTWASGQSTYTLGGTGAAIVRFTR